MIKFLVPAARQSKGRTSSHFSVSRGPVSRARKEYHQRRSDWVCVDDIRNVPSEQYDLIARPVPKILIACGPYSK